jgi:hypothetical protein
VERELEVASGCCCQRRREASRDLAAAMVAAEVCGRGVRRNADGNRCAQAAAKACLLSLQTFAKVESLEHLDCLSQIVRILLLSFLVYLK